MRTGRRLRLLVIAATLSAVLLPTASSSAKAGHLVEFPVPVTTGRPGAITPGPEGDLWFLQRSKLPGFDSPGQVGRITPSGKVKSCRSSPTATIRPTSPSAPMATSGSPTKRRTRSSG